MSQKLSAAISVIGIDIGKNSFHVVISEARSHCGRFGHAARWRPELS